MTGKFNSLRPQPSSPSCESIRRDCCRLRFEPLEQRWMLSTTPIIGQVDDFQDLTTPTQHWTNGFSAAEPINVAGGPGGISDRFLQISSGTFGGGSRLVVFNQSQWIGNYVATGVTSVEMDLKNFTASAESIRIALRSSAGGSLTPGYSSTTAFALPADSAWHHAVFGLDSGSLTGVNSPAALSTFLTSVGDFRILEAAAGPALIGDAGNFQVGVDNITAVGQQELSFQPLTVSMPEGNAGPTPFVFTVALSHDSGATVNYATADGTATTADSDYIATSGTLTFAPGVTSQQITVTVNGDTIVEPDENFFVNLSNPTNSTIATPQATGTIVNDDSTVAGRFTFYAGSARYDQPGGTNGRPPGTFSDDNAIATDKSAYVPTPGVANASATRATMANLTSYDQGIDGIMVDLSTPGGSHASITQAAITTDFTFRVGNNNSPASWITNTILPATVTVRAGAGVGGSDRVELIWANPGITQKWLEVIVKATANTGLAANDTFFFGNEIGDTGSSNTSTFALVSSSDVTGAQTHGATLKANIPDTNLYDFNRDGVVTSADVTIAQTHGTNTKNGLLLIQLGSLSGPFAPAPGDAPASSSAPAASSDSGVASALAASTSSSSPSLTLNSTWVVDRLSKLDLNSGPIATFLEHLADEGTARSQEILVKADHVADALGLDDELLDGLLVGLGLE